MTRTALKDRSLPDYTRGEEIFNMVSHIVGGALGALSLVLCSVYSAIYSGAYAVVSSVIYSASLILLYSASSIYHGLYPNMGKKVMQVIDHCTIYFLIAGTYTPIALCPIREYSSVWGWGIFAAIWALCAVGVVFTAIDFNKYSKLSMALYIGMGWCIVAAGKIAIASIPKNGLILLLIGGISYTLGAVMYALGSKRRYFHGIFHIFVLIGSILHFFCIFFYVI
jgi:hemolysin III